jgi:hypothetical protein
LSIDSAGRQERRICHPEAGACLKDAGGCLREIQILLQCKRHQAGKLWITKACPPRDEVGAGISVPELNCRLAQVAIWQVRVRPGVVRPDSATGGNTGDSEHKESTFE